MEGSGHGLLEGLSRLLPARTWKLRQAGQSVPDGIRISLLSNASQKFYRLNQIARLRPVKKVFYLVFSVFSDTSDG
jgi:hypothetical protein